MKFVVIDDSPDVLVLLRTVLGRRGHEVLTYTNPLDCPIYTSMCCPCTPNACPDVIVSDIDMPHATGLDFVKRVRGKMCKCKHVALISGRKLSSEALTFLQETGVSFFEKPVNFDEFDEWLNRGSQAKA